MAQGDVIFGLHGIMPVANTDVLQTWTDGKQTAVTGEIGWQRDGFSSLRLFTFRKNESTATIAKGDLMSRKLLVITNVDSGATTSVTDSTTFGTDGLYAKQGGMGALLYVHDDAGAAGAAPEGEVTLITSVNSTGATATFETDLPLSAALAVNDDVTVLSPHVIDAADGDYNYVVCGVAMAAAADEEWSWYQFQGLHPAVLHKNSGVTAGDPVVADVAQVGPYGSDVANLWVGYQVGTFSSDNVLLKSAVVMSLLPVYI